MGPLSGLRVIEIAGQGPGPFAAMMLADMGAEVLRIDRADKAAPREEYEWRADYLLDRGRRSLAVDLKHRRGVETVLRLAERADALVEGFRPGVLERLGLGPEDCLARNPRLVYGRVTGWGQDGPMAMTPGHDINYVALSGVLHALGEEGGPPVPAINLLGDFGGGGMLLAFGIVCGMLEASRSGEGQVVDAAMLDGVSLLGTMLQGMRQTGQWGERGTNLLDGGAPFYGVYETADGKWVAVGAIEPKFYSALLAALGIDEAELSPQMDRDSWPAVKERIAAAFRTRGREEWCREMRGVEACFAPVLDPDEVASDEHVVARRTMVEAHGVRQPAPAPRFGRTPGAIGAPPPAPGEHTGEALREWGFGPDEVAALREGGAVR